MFLERLEPKARQAVLDLMVFVASADYDMAEEEIEHLQHLAKTFGLKLELDVSKLNPHAALNVLENYSEKIVAIIEMIKLSYKDGHYGPEEQRLVLDFAAKMGIGSTDLLIAIESWVRKGLEWMDEGEEIIRGSQFVN